jgi:hypothetical protein
MVHINLKRTVIQEWVEKLLLKSQK